MKIFIQKTSSSKCDEVELRHIEEYVNKHVPLINKKNILTRARKALRENDLETIRKLLTRYYSSTMTVIVEE